MSAIHAPADLFPARPPGCVERDGGVVRGAGHVRGHAPEAANGVLGSRRSTAGPHARQHTRLSALHATHSASSPHGLAAHRGLSCIQVIAIPRAIAHKIIKIIETVFKPKRDTTRHNTGTAAK